MRKTWKKLLVMGLALGMVFAGSAVTSIRELTVQAAGTNIAEGCIDEDYGQITWVIDSNGHLTVSGTGGVVRYPLNQKAPWYSFREQIKTAEVHLTGSGYLSYMFYDCTNLTSVDLSGLDTSNVGSMNSMFYGCSSLTELDLSGLDTSKVGSIDVMFAGCSSLTELDVSGFDTSNVTEMQFIFSGCSSLENLDASRFDTSNVRNMAAMFQNCSSLKKLDVSGFDTSNVTDMHLMFSGCSSLENLDASRFDTSNVTNMAAMFSGCSSLTELDVSGFDTSNVTDMEVMFLNCSSLTELDLGSFDMKNVTNARDMIVGKKGPYFDLVKIITPKNLQIKVKLPTIDSKLFDWQDEENNIFVELPCGMSESKHLVVKGNFQYPVQGEKNNITWSIDKSGHLLISGSGELQDKEESVVVLGDLPWGEYRELIKTAEINVKNMSNASELFFGCSNLTKVDLSNFDTSSVTDMSYMFGRCSSLTELDVSEFDTSRVKHMGGMFQDCVNLVNLDLNDWDTSNVQIMWEMFSGCSSLEELDLSNWNTSKVRGMSSMFKNCSSLTELDVSGFDTRNVSNMEEMFYGCSSLIELDLSSFNTSKIADCPFMFKGCKNLQYIYGKFDLSNALDTWGMYEGCINLKNTPTGLPAAGVIQNKQGNITWEIGMDEKLTVNGTGDFLVDGEGLAPWLAYADKFKTAEVHLSGVTNLSGMFEGCLNLLKVDLNGLNTENVTDMSDMFKGCKNLYNVDVSNFDTRNVTDMSGMFANCPFLSEIDLSGFDTRNVTDMSQMFSGCSYTRKLDLSGLDMSNVQYVDDFVKGCSEELQEIKAPKHCNFDIDLIGAWQDKDNNLYTSLPQGLSDSVTISKIYGQIEWSLDNAGHLTVNGVGNFSENGPGPMPWYSVRDQIKTAEVHLIGATCIAQMFNGCSNLTEVDLSGLDTSDVVRMEYMFRNCSSLESIDVSDFDTSNVKYMYNMFEGCSSLTEIDLSNWKISNAHHMDGMFNGCSKLKEIDLSGFDTAGMGLLDEWLFEECFSLETIKTPLNWAYDIYLPTEKDDDVWYGSDGKEYGKLPKRLPYSITLTKNQLPSTGENETFTYEDQVDGTIMITGYSSENPAEPVAFFALSSAFSGGTPARNVADKKALLIPTEIDGKKVTAIKENAFANSSEIISVQIPQSVEKIGANAFANCVNLSNVIVGENIKTIGNRAFENCENLAVISFEKNIPEIEENTFENVSAKVYYRKEVSDQTANLKEKMEPAIEMVSFEKYPIATQCSDINTKAWYIEYVQDVYDRELMTGSDGSFKPNDNVTRAQFITTLYRLAGEPGVDDYRACDVFPDVKRDKYYTNAVCWAYNEGITTGSNGKFNTTGYLSRQQLATFVFRFAEVMNYDLTARGDYSSMKNAHKVSDYAKTAIQWAIGSGLISGSKTTDQNGNQIYDLNPEGKTTRAQLSAILERFCVENKIITKKSGI